MDGFGDHLHNSNMPQPDRPARPPAAPGALPTYALYGEHGRTQATEGLHCERIAERSQCHDWEIRPHRHATLYQILHLQRGSATAWLASGSQALTGPCVLLMPALVPHGFVFLPDVEGTVVTVLEHHWRRLLQGAAPLVALLMQPALLQWPAGAPAAASVDDAVHRLREAFADTGAWRDLAQDAALLHLAVVLGRLLPAADRPGAGVGAGAGAPASGTRALGHVRRFRDLVDVQFRQQPTLTALSHGLGITPTQLNRLCHQVLGHSALGVLHGRLVLEAQRDLAYTTQSVKQIGGSLGFADAAYFTRFFLRLTGHTPTAWRALTAR